MTFYYIMTRMMGILRDDCTVLVLTL